MLAILGKTFNCKNDSRSDVGDNPKTGKTAGWLNDVANAEKTEKTGGSRQSRFRPRSPIGTGALIAVTAIAGLAVIGGPSGMNMAAALKSIPGLKSAPGFGIAPGANSAPGSNMTPGSNTGNTFGKNQGPAPVATVTMQPAQLQQIPDTLALTGSISATDPLTIGSSSNGLVITQVNAEEGDYVKKGQILCELDSSVLRAQLAASEARLQGARASLTKAAQPNRPEDIGSFEAAYKQALADVQNRKAMLEQAMASSKLAQRNAQRYSLLFKEGAVSELDAQTKETEASTTSSTVQAAQDTLEASEYAAQQAANRLKLAHEGGRREDVMISEASANETAASVQQMRAQIEQTIVRAPDEGLITKKYAHIGDVSSGGKPLFEMIRRGNIELRAQVSQDDISRLTTNQAVTISDGTRKADGTVFLISPTVDATTRMGIVRIALPKGTDFKPGMFVRGTVERGRRSALVVPNSAVLADGDLYFVFVYDNGVAKKRPVSVGARVKDAAEIIEGLQAGEEVIVAGAGFLNDLDPVAVGR